LCLCACGNQMFDLACSHMNSKHLPSKANPLAISVSLFFRSSTYTSSPPPFRRWLLYRRLSPVSRRHKDSASSTSRGRAVTRGAGLVVAGHVAVGPVAGAAVARGWCSGTGVDRSCGSDTCAYSDRRLLTAVLLFLFSSSANLATPPLSRIRFLLNPDSTSSI